LLERDFSQAFLLLVAPVSSAIVSLGFLVLIKFIFNPGGRLGFVWTRLILFVGIFYLIIFAYLFFWIAYLLWLERKVKKSG
jgi:hypothetical protein